MVSTETLQVIINAKDQLSSKVKEINNTIRQTGTTANSSSTTASSATDRIGAAYDRLKNKVTTAFNNIKNTIRNSSTVQTISESTLAQPFMNAAEKIRNKWQTLMQQIRSSKAKPSIDTSNMTVAEQKIATLKTKINQVNGISAKPRFDITEMKRADGQIQVIVKDLKTLRNQQINLKVNGNGAELNNISNIIDKVYQRAQKLNNTKVDVKVSSAGLQTLDGQINRTAQTMQRLQGTRFEGLNSAIMAAGNAFNTLSTKAQTAFSKIKSGITGAKDKLTNLASGMSGIQGAIMGAFGVVGVTSIKSFTIEAAIAREKVNAVTKSVTGSQQAFEKTQKSIKSAIAGTTLGYNNMAKAVNNVALRFHLSGEAVSKLPGPMAKVGLMAQAMGKSSEEAAKIMESAFDGLQNKWRGLKQIGITKEDLIGAGWSGAADDVEGYSRALDKVLEKNPKFKEFTQTFEYQWESFKMSIKGVGTEIGMTLLPILKTFLGFLTDLSKQHPWLLKIAVVIGLVVLALASIATVILPIIMLIDAIKEITIVTTIWNAVLAMNPIVIVIAAIIALIAVMWYLYNTNESVRQAFDHMGQVINNILVKGWETLQKIIQPLIPTFNHLMQVLGRLWNIITGGAGATDEAGKKMDAWGMIANALAFVIQLLVEHMVKMVEFVVAILVPALNLVINILSAIISFVASVIEAFGLLAQGDFAGFIQTFLEAFGTLGTEILTYLGQFVIELLNNIGTVLFGADAQFGTWLYNFILNGVNGAISFVTGFINGICQLPGQLWTWLWQSITKTITWATQMKDKFIKAASDAVTGFIEWVKTLPGRFWTWLVNTYNKVIAFKNVLIQKIKDAASSAVNGFKEKVQKLPQIMWDELMNIGRNISNSVGTLVQKIKELGWRLLDGFKSALGINSPGHISDAIGYEMGHIKDHLTESYGTLRKAAYGLGTNILNGFNSSGADTLTSVVSGADAKNTLSYEVTHTIKKDNEDEDKNKGEDLFKYVKEIHRYLKGIHDGSNTPAKQEFMLKQDGSLKLSYDIDLSNVPNNMDEATLKEVLLRLINDKDVIKAITSSREFQDMDSKIKKRILGELARHI